MAAKCIQILKTKKISEENFFTLFYDQKNTLNPLVKFVFKSVDNYWRYLQFCDRRVCSSQYVATQRLQLGRYFALGNTCPVHLFLVYFVITYLLTLIYHCTEHVLAIDSGRSSGRYPVRQPRPVTTFTMAELQDGLVQYIRSNRSSHNSPLYDSFDVFVSDGRQNSSVGKVEIAFDQSTSARLDFQVDPIQVGTILCNVFTTKHYNVFPQDHNHEEKTHNKANYSGTD